MRRLSFISRFDFLIIPALLFITLIILVSSNFYTPKLSSYVIIDFLVTIPVVYAFLIRKGKAYKLTIITVFLIGFITASNLLPKEDSRILELVKTFIIPLIEIGVLSFIIYKSHLVYQSFKKNNKNIDFYDTIQIASKEVFPGKLGYFLATEIAVVYYALFSWKKKENSKHTFTYHKEGTYTGVLLGFALVVIVEIFVLHVLLVKWSVIGAWIITFLSFYTLLQIVAITKSFAKRPIYFNEEKGELVLKHGFVGLATIPIQNIKEIETTSKEIENKQVKYFSFLGSLSGGNTIIHLETPITYESIYGFKKEAKALALIVDEKTVFSEFIAGKKREILH